MNYPNFRFDSSQESPDLLYNKDVTICKDARKVSFQVPVNKTVSFKLDNPIFATKYLRFTVGAFSMEIKNYHSERQFIIKATREIADRVYVQVFAIDSKNRNNGEPYIIGGVNTLRHIESSSDDCDNITSSYIVSLSLSEQSTRPIGENYIRLYDLAYS